MKSLPNMFFCGALLYFFMLVNTGQAALPPLYASLNEYKSLLSSQELAQKFGSAEGIQNVKRNENGFIVTGYKHTLHVDVVFDPQSHPGPAKFHFVFHELEPIESQ